MGAHGDDEPGRSQADFPVLLEEIIERIKSIDTGRYRSTRNYFSGAVSRLSPYISRGVISCKQVLEQMPGDPMNDPDSAAFIQQLAWREYFQRVWQNLGNNLFEDIRQPQENVSGNGIPFALLNNSTGLTAVDKQLELLQSTGYIHNHARMYIASLACNFGRMHWVAPAEWMYYHLLDGDLASNTCSWQWVAGSFSSKKYYFNQDNLNTYSGMPQRNTFIDAEYDALPRLPIPVSLREVHHPKLVTELPHTEIPSLDTGIPTLVYNSYNLDPNWRAGEAVNRVLLLEPGHFHRFPVSKKVIDFVLALAGNIQDVQVFVGEIGDLAMLYNRAGIQPNIISREHPAFSHYPGRKDPREWLFPEVTDFYPSFSKYWKQCRRSLP